MTLRVLRVLPALWPRTTFGRSWEQWVLGNDMPASLTEMVRWIANDREPPADGVAVAQFAFRPTDDPPVPGAEIVAERAGVRLHTWAPLSFPDGPKGRPTAETLYWMTPQPVAAADAWLGVHSTAPIVVPEDA